MPVCGRALECLPYQSYQGDTSDAQDKRLEKKKERAGLIIRHDLKIIYPSVPILTYKVKKKINKINFFFITPLTIIFLVIKYC